MEGKKRKRASVGEVACLSDAELEAQCVQLGLDASASRDGKVALIAAATLGREGKRHCVEKVKEWVSSTDAVLKYLGLIPPGGVTMMDLLQGKLAKIRQNQQTYLQHNQNVYSQTNANVRRRSYAAPSPSTFPILPTVDEFERDCKKQIVPPNQHGLGRQETRAKTMPSLPVLDPQLSHLYLAAMHQSMLDASSSHSSFVRGVDFFATSKNTQQHS